MNDVCFFQFKINYFSFHMLFLVFVTLNIQFFWTWLNNSADHKTWNRIAIHLIDKTEFLIILVFVVNGLVHIFHHLSLGFIVFTWDNYIQVKCVSSKFNLSFSYYIDLGVIVERIKLRSKFLHLLTQGHLRSSIFPVVSESITKLSLSYFKHFTNPLVLFSWKHFLIVVKYSSAEFSMKG